MSGSLDLGERAIAMLTTAAAGPTSATLDLSFSPSLRLIATVRRFVSEFYTEVLGNPDATSRLTIATHELLENAVKYSSDGHTSVHIAVIYAGGDTSTVTIDTRNRAAPAHLVTLAGMFDELGRAPTPMDFYQALMRRSAKRTEGSGLGLGRIHAEADMDLSYRVDGEMVLLRAQSAVSTRSLR
jgi:hypothetical protein